MSVTVRPVDLDAERETLLGVLERNLPELPHARRFDWLYRRNPVGRAFSWFVCEGKSGRVVGVASLIQRAIRLGGTVQLAGQVGDFAIDAEYRSLGPAVLLQRATFEPVDCGRLSFCYDCPPHEAGMSTFRRLGMKENCRMVRYARLLRSERELKKRLGGVWAGALVAPANAVLRLRVQRSVSSHLAIAEHVGSIGEEFSRIDEAYAQSKGVRSRRHAEDLNWRYREDPLRQYFILTARRGAELLAYVVYTAAGEDATVVDLFGREMPDAGVALLAEVSERCRARGIQTLHAYLSEGNPAAETFVSSGFQMREAAARVVAYAKPGSEVAALLAGRAPWSFSQTEILA